MKNCSIIIPIHNEALHLEEFIIRFWDNLGELQKRVIEIQLVENGSNDNSLEICQNLGKKFPKVIVARHIPHPSYGEAIKSGMLNAKGEIVSILECDYLDIEFFSYSLAVIDESKTDFVLASKRHPDSVDKRPLKRRIITYLFNLFLKLFFNIPISDTHGLKTIRSEVAKKLCDLSITGGEIFQTEIVMLAYRLGYHVLEIPIHIYEKRSPSISIIRRIPKVINIFIQLKRSLRRFPDNKLREP
ncbi:MAG: glycosyltransferase family 2 protein [bacterium]